MTHVNPTISDKTPQETAPRRSVRGGIAIVTASALVGAGIGLPVGWLAARGQESAPAADSATVGEGAGSVDLAAGHDGPPWAAAPEPWSFERGRPGIDPRWGGTPRAPQAGSIGPGFGTFEDATDEESTGVVLIEVAAHDAEGAGTGWVLDDSGLVVTNYHVVSGSETVSVTDAATEDSYEAEVVGYDESVDVALLRIDNASGLEEADLDDDGAPAVGDEVTAVGNAEGQGYLSASSGTVTALDQDITTTDVMAGTRDQVSGLIQTDAYVVVGFSGGVMLDGEGEVVGLTTAASTGRVSESYAVPVDDALEVVDLVLAGNESGSVQIGPVGYLGIAVEAGTDSVRVAEVEDGGAAESAGVGAGDTITGLGDVTVTSLTELQSTIDAYEPGDRVALAWTDAAGDSHRAQVTLGEAPTN